VVAAASEGETVMQLRPVHRRYFNVGFVHPKTQPAAPVAYLKLPYFLAAVPLPPKLFSAVEVNHCGVDAER
jgi:hypothetical protein